MRYDFVYGKVISQRVEKMAQQTQQVQQVPMQRMVSYDREGLQRLQQEIDQEQYNLQRMTSEEERADRRKMRELFESVRIFFIHFVIFLLYFVLYCIVLSFCYEIPIVYSKNNYEFKFVFSWIPITMVD